MSRRKTSFDAKVIKPNRITIPDTSMKKLDLEVGDLVTVNIEVINESGSDGD